jgi:hypothetical protein
MPKKVERQKISPGGDGPPLDAERRQEDRPPRQEDQQADHLEWDEEQAQSSTAGT